MSEQIRERFRRWGYLQAQVDTFGRIPHFPLTELDSVEPVEAKRWREIYCSNVGAEFMHMPYPERCNWVADRMENPRPLGLDRNFILQRILSAETFEQFIHRRYVGAKRFSLEGLAVVIPFLDAILERAANQGFELVLIGMSHRGRLNVLHHIAQAEASKIFAGFEDVDPKSVLGSGDVKYHKGASGTYTTQSGKQIQIRLASNPSHLEAITPVVMGRARAYQDRIKDKDYSKVLVVALHGDAAFAGQGITAETLNFAELNGFTVGGTIHIIVNNLIGFTTIPENLFSGRFATDVAKRLPIPIFHVNGLSPDDCVRVAEMTMDYRKQFLSDVTVDLIGFRRFGHNETDDPTVTSPKLYERIKNHPELYETYAEQLGVSKEEVKKLEAEFEQRLSHEQEVGQKMTSQPAFFVRASHWNGYFGDNYKRQYEVPTAVSAEVIKDITDRITSIPSGFTIHPKLGKLLEQRKEMGYGEKPIDWGMAEALAFGSLLREGYPVRVVGQDSRRGTFSHRQAVLYDYETEQAYTPLQYVSPNQAEIQIYDSMLSEAAAVAYEYGYSRDYPEALVCWEAQFGDFVNGAQIIIDQFICAAEDKWSLLSGLVMLLPHGFEGQGPEHSSARVERFLQLAAEHNIQVVYPSTSDQYFHLLRRQVLRKWRKPLIVITPKSMLRAPVACGSLKQFTDHSFYMVMEDTEYFPNAERILIGTGKIVHELRAERKRQNVDNIAVISIEQLYPFPEEDLVEILNKYPQAKTLVWVQEEPANMGALSFVKPLLERIAGSRNVTTVRRSASASPATGSPKAHALEQEAIIKLAFAKYA